MVWVSCGTDLSVAEIVCGVLEQAVAVMSKAIARRIPDGMQRMDMTGSRFGGKPTAWRIHRGKPRSGSLEHSARDEVGDPTRNGPDRPSTRQVGNVLERRFEVRCKPGHEAEKVAQKVVQDR